MSAIVKLYCDLVKANARTFEQIPVSIRERVRSALIEEFYNKVVDNEITLEQVHHSVYNEVAALLKADNT